MYNSTQRLVPNPINRYWIGADTQGIKYNSDGSLDIYIQPQSPGQAKENNWLQLFSLQKQHGNCHRYE
jgi:hypothetical protein